MKKTNVKKRCKKSAFTPSRIRFDTAIKRYPNRFTLEHIPSWALKPLFGKYFAPLYASDREWYDNTQFPEEIEQLPRDQCLSKNFSYPIGKWLKRQYYIGMTKEEGGYEEPIDEFAFLTEGESPETNQVLEAEGM